MRNLASATALAAALTFAGAAPAAANEKRDFEQCDGRIHPGSQDDGMRGEASQSLFFPSFGRPDTSIAACDRALASSRLLPSQTLRRAHLLRARAAKQLQGGDPDKALLDLDLAEAAVAGRASDRFHQRSMGVSLTMLRAMALLAKGDKDRALALARSASEARPYSSRVQRLTADIVHAAGGRPDWSRAARLDPASTLTAFLRSAEVGNWTEVLALRNSVSAPWPETIPNAYVLLAPRGNGELLAAVMVAMHSSYALAATGRPAEAKSELESLRARLKAVATPLTKDGKKDGPDVGQLLLTVLEGQFRMTEARIAVAEGRTDDALARIVAQPLPKTASAVDLLTALKGKATPAQAALIPTPAALALAPSEDGAKKLLRMTGEALLTPETPRAVVDYEKSRPNILGALIGGALTMGTSLLGGISRLDGFRSTPNADGTVKVEFVGNTPSPQLVEEMTLLRSAELTRAASKPAFEIVSRKDYQRVLTTTQYGRTISSTPQGFKTEFTIRFIDRPDGNARALDALSVIDSLGPLYYEDKPARRS